MKPNLISSRAQWQSQRELAERAPGDFHGEIAVSEIYWYDPKVAGWIRRSEKSWSGYSASNGQALTNLNLKDDHVPWKKAFDDSQAPFYRWFQGGLTNAGFNEVDVHCLAGHGDETAFIYEGEEWIGNARDGHPKTVERVSRAQLLQRVSLYGDVLQRLGLKQGDRVVMNLPNGMEQIYLIEACKRLGLIYTCVFSGLSAKTIAERVVDSGAKILIGISSFVRNGQIVSALSEHLTPALQDYLTLVNAEKLLLQTGVKSSAADSLLKAFASEFDGEIVISRHELENFWSRHSHERNLASAKLKFSEVQNPLSLDQILIVDRTEVRERKIADLNFKLLSQMLLEAQERYNAASGDAIAKAWNLSRPVPVDAEFPLFIAYTSGSTGKPKGIVHTHGGYTVGLARSMSVCFDVQPGRDTLYCIADPGWITGQSYMISAALLKRVTSIVAEFAPLFPFAGRFASVIERHQATLLKAGSTFLRSVAADSKSVAELKSFNLRSLRSATFCAEPTSPALQQFGMENIVPRYINSYWATEHGGIILTHFAGCSDIELRADTHAHALPWVFADVWISVQDYDRGDRSCSEYRRAEAGEKGELVITKPYPYLARTIWGDPNHVGEANWVGDLERFRKTYFERWSESGSQGAKIVLAYTQGDFGCRYEDGSFTLHGRSDEVINTSGHRIGTEEIEGAILKDKLNDPNSPVGNVVVVGGPHEERGQVPIAFIRLNGAKALSAEDELRLTSLVVAEKGEVAVPEAYLAVSQLPETRSGKYMRRYLKAILNGEEMGDTSTLRNPEALDEVRTVVERWKARTQITVEAGELELLVRKATDLEEKIDFIRLYLQKQMATLIGAGEEGDLPLERPVRDLGLSSLKALQFIKRVQTAVGSKLATRLSVTALFNYPTLAALTDFLVREVFALKSESEPTSRRQKSANRPDNKDEPIAIVGIGCRFPGGVSDPESFWTLLKEGRNAISEIPKDRWRIDDFFSSDKDSPGRMYVRHGGFLNDVDKFDAEFFGISPSEATALDPQHRLLMETTWEALENAGLAPHSLSDTDAAVFVGITTREYAELLENAEERENFEQYIPTGNNINTASGRLSFFLNIKGPSVSVDTACSSSLVALHLACQSLNSGECEVAIAAGVNLMLTPSFTINLCRANALSSDGQCKTFDEDANGYVRSEGCGVLILKPLSAALESGDRILSVIAATNVNQDGRSASLTAPNGLAQEELIQGALAKAKIEPSAVSYVEAHGTGTPLGDPIEVAAIAKAYGQGRSANNELRLGSVKTNIGHTESAAGMAGVIKTSLALQRRQIPPHALFRRLNPHIQIEQIPARIPVRLEDWSAQQIRHAGVSSFGFSGTNAHVILREPPAAAEPGARGGEHHGILCLSARSTEALDDLASRYVQFLEAHPDVSLNDLCFTALTGRTHFAHRLAVPALGIDELKSKLSAKKGVAGQVEKLKGGKLGFLFSGQGSQYSGMAKELYRTNAIFRASLDRSVQILNPLLGRNLLELIFNSSDGGELDQTCFTQPSLFAIEYALYELWQSWGFQPAAVIGHSVGEVVAACAAGVFSLEDGLRLIVKRAQLMQALKGQGGMLAAMAPEEKVRSVLGSQLKSVSIAAVNGPQVTTLAGFSDDLSAAEQILKQAGVRTKALAVSHAFHSQQMDPMLDEFEAFAATLDFRAPKIAVISNLSGKMAGPEMATPAYWRRHVREAVRFADGIRAMYEMGIRSFVELGPTTTLIGMAKDCVPDDAELTWQSSLKRGRADMDQIMEALSGLYCRGWSLRPEIFSLSRPNKIALPTYPFRKNRYWAGRVQRHGGLTLPAGSHPLLGVKTKAARSDEVIYQTELSTDDPAAFLGDHFVFGTVVVPATTFIDMVFAAGEECLGGCPLVIEGMTVEQPLILRPGDRKRMQLCLAPDGESADWRWQIFSQLTSENEWKAHCAGRVRLYQEAVPSLNFAEPIAQVKARCTQQQDREVFYQALFDGGLELGRRFRGISSLSTGPGVALGHLDLVKDLESEDHLYHFHPSHLDCAQQVATSIYSVVHANPTQPRGFLPVAFDKIVFYKRPARQLWSHVEHRVGGGLADKIMKADIRVVDENEDLVVEYHGFTMVEAPREALQRMVRREQPSSSSRDMLYEITWRERQVGPPAESQSAPWLIFSDRLGLGNKLCERLRAKNISVEVIEHEASKLRDESVFDSVVSPAIEKITAGQGALRVAFLWSLDFVEEFKNAPQTQELTSDKLLLEQREIYWAALRTSQLVLKKSGLADVRCGFVTRGARAATEQQAIAPNQATLWGLGQVINMEYPELQVLRLDLDPKNPSADSDSEVIIRELGAAELDDQVAYREQKRKVARLIRSQTPTAPTQPMSETLKSEATYLITGGLGGLGLASAEWLAKAGARHLVLTGRRAPDAETRNQMEAISKSTGAKLYALNADIAKEGEVKELIAKISRDLPPLAGIIHAAGVIQDSGLLQQDWSKFESVVAPKMLGAWNLHRATTSLKLDFFLIFSSATSLIGNRGQANYAAANAFLDAFSAYRKSMGLAATSVNWGPWAGSGMAARVESAQKQLAELGLDMIPLEEGMTVMGSLLQSQPTQIGVLK